MRFNQPTDYSPGTGNTVLLTCQLSHCHPPSQHMGCVRSKKAAEQLSAVFLPPPAPSSSAKFSTLLAALRAAYQQCREYKVRQEHSKGMTLPLLPGLSISAWFQPSLRAQEDTLYHMQPKINFKKCLLHSWRSVHPNHEWSDTFCLPISFFSFTSSAVATELNFF